MSVPFPNRQDEAGTLRYDGELVFFYAFDIAYDMLPTEIRSLLGRRLDEFAVPLQKKAPRLQTFVRPLTAALDPVTVTVGGSTASVAISVKLLPIGAISLTMRLPFAGLTLRELDDWETLGFDSGALTDHAFQLAQKIRAELLPHVVRPVDAIVRSEAYTVFCLRPPADAAHFDAEAWLAEHGSEVAGLLCGELDVGPLAASKTAETLRRRLSYYRGDIAIFDWDAALILDREKDAEEILFVIELANLQLEELEAYDRYADTALERAYRDLSAPRRRSRADVIRELRELSIDLARFSDELLNITKFFGEWHTALVYEHVSSRFHLSDWHRRIEQKLEILDTLYGMLREEVNTRWMLRLEVAVVVLFIVDLAILFWGGH